MTVTRLSAWTLLLFATWLLAPTGVASQSNATNRDPVVRASDVGLFDLRAFDGVPILQEKESALPTKNSGAFEKVRDLQAERGIDKKDLESVRGNMKLVAEYYASFVTHPLIYRIIQDPSKMPPNTDPDSVKIDKKIEEMGRYVLEPLPSLRNPLDSTQLRVPADKADYIREMGAALDVALMKVVNEHPERIVKINAMRMYVAACKSGAAAHWPTVTALLKNENTRPEIKFYALQAAANLLAAYDPADYQSRRHAIGSKLPRAEADKEIGALVKAVEDCVLDPNKLLGDIPERKIEKIDADQLEVVRYMRRQAIRALAEVRFVTLPGPEGKEKPLYPAHTLARVCVSDPKLVPAPSPSECAEAVIGLSNMAPIWERAPVKNYNSDAVAEAVATGLITFATPRAANVADRTAPWVRTSTRMNDALKGWRPLYNFLYDPVKPTPTDGDGAPAVLTDLITRAQNSVLTPMSQTNPAMPERAPTVSLESLKTFLKARQDDPKRTGILFTGVPETALPVAEKKN